MRWLLLLLLLLLVTLQYQLWFRGGMNDVWELLYFSDVEREMSEAKLSFATSAHLLDAIDQINLSEPQRKMLGEIDDPLLRESTRDYMVNQQFRRDIFVKGRVGLSADRMEAQIRETRFVLAVPLSNFSLKIRGALGDADANEKVYRPVAEVLSTGPKNTKEILADSRAAHISPPELLHCLYILTGAGQVHPCLGTENLEERRKSTDAFNNAILERAPYFGELRYLASPVLGGGVGLDRLHQLFLLAERRNVEPKAFVDNLMKRNGEQFLVEGKAITDPAQHQVELAKRFDTYREKQRPLLSRLGIV